MVKGLQKGREHHDPGHHQKRDHSKPLWRSGAIFAPPTVTAAIVQMPSEQLEGLPPVALCLQFGSRFRRRSLKAVFG
jgi:hypothetical protein